MSKEAAFYARSPCTLLAVRRWSRGWLCMSTATGQSASTRMADVLRAIYVIAVSRTGNAVEYLICSIAKLELTS
ncbi:hypothetical protein R69919_05072 [Paraburkholderia gardini]|uniref:Secreted protein n=1 Tax=Paraburkholderia gardini TaxID=2823469 RepID=A0ABM8U9I2_9BURK|nr:hypothetical protein R54767_04622 [Paraburkholderia gardini]CAG4923129.1 hypothetical protein R69919_05072 [Paraburkholderia gardini]